MRASHGERVIRGPGTPVRVDALLGNSQRLDGGAMFGSVPRAMWSRWIEPDERGRIPLACRAMLVTEDGGRRVLCEAGIGAFFEPRLADRYGVVEREHVLLRSLAALGVAPEDIDVIVLSHLHFDHAGGLLAAWAPERVPSLAFSRASYVVSEPAWQRALAPHARDRASYIPALQPLIAETARLERVVPDPDGATQSPTLGTHYRLHLSDGHTPGLMLTEVATADGPLVFASDLIPGAPWVHLPVTMGYDRFPELLVDEKAALLADLVRRGGSLFFTHDHAVAIARVTYAEGRFAAAAT